MKARIHEGIAQPCVVTMSAQPRVTSDSENHSTLWFWEAYLCPKFLVTYFMLCVLFRRLQILHLALTFPTSTIAPILCNLAYAFIFELREHREFRFILSIKHIWFAQYFCPFSGILISIRFWKLTSIWFIYNHKTLSSSNREHSAHGILNDSLLHLVQSGWWLWHTGFPSTPAECSGKHSRFGQFITFFDFKQVALSNCLFCLWINDSSSFASLSHFIIAEIIGQHFHLF